MNDSFDYQAGYMEMRNMAAFIINIIAGEIDNGITIVDADTIDNMSDDDQQKERLRGKKRGEKALGISFRLGQEISIPQTLEEHDVTLNDLLNGLTLISTEYSPDPLFIMGSVESLNEQRIAEAEAIYNKRHPQ